MEEATTRRGRPLVFSEQALARAKEFSYARHVSTRRAEQDLVYRMFATAVLEHYCEAFPESAQTLHWFLQPRRRHTLLTELGRFAEPRSDSAGNLFWNESGAVRLVEAALELADTRPTTKAGAIWLRRRRLAMADAP